MSALGEENNKNELTERTSKERESMLDRDRERARRARETDAACTCVCVCGQECVWVVDLQIHSISLYVLGKFYWDIFAIIS